MPTSSEPAAQRDARPASCSRWLGLAGLGGARPAGGEPGSVAFTQWRAELVAAVRRLSGAADRPPAAGARLVRSATAGGLTREEHELAADVPGGPGGPVRVIVTYLPGGRSLPAVVVCPGRNAAVAQVTGEQPPDFPDRNVAERFARAGLLAVTLDYRLDGQLDRDRLAGRDEAAVLAQLLALRGVPLLGVLAGDAAAAAAWTGSHPAAAPGPAALFGHSLGGAVALHAALLGEQRAPLCVASHLGTYRVIGYGHPALALPGIGRHADLPDLFGAHAPAPLQVQYGTRDPWLDPADAAAAGRRVADRYAAAGAPGGAEVIAGDMGHGTDAGAAIGFLRRTLAARPAAEPAREPVPGTRVGFDAAMRAQVAGAVELALGSGTLTLGPLAERFEAGLTGLLGRPAVAVDSGSSALEIALRVIGVAGRIVLVPVNTFVATAAAAVRAGAGVDFVDLEPAGLGLSPGSLAGRLRRHGGAVAAVIVMHTGGIVAPSLREVLGLCKEAGVPVVEDAAHAFGSALDGRPAGTLADYGAFSFYPTKVLTTGEGGAVTAADPARLAVFRRLRDHGRSAPGATTHDALGSNWRLSELHAAVGLAQLAAFPGRTAARRRLAARYDAGLAGLRGLRVQPVPANATTSWYKYIAWLPDGTDRAALKDRLRRSHGVALAGEVYDILLCDQPYFAGIAPATDFPDAGTFAASHICLPLYPELSDARQDRVIAALREELC